MPRLIKGVNGRLARACHQLVWHESGKGCMRRMPVLRLLAVAPLRRIVAPRPATHAPPSHSQTNFNSLLRAYPSRERL